MIRVVKQGSHMLRVDGIRHGDGITARALEGAIRHEQARLAGLFGRQLTVRGPLKANTAAYTKWKLKHGYSGDRGHKTGETQGVLDTRVLWSVRVVRKKGKRPYAVLQFFESRLIELAPQYEHYRDSMDKTAEGEGVLIVTQRFAQALQRVLRRVQAGSADPGRAAEELEVEWRRFAA